MSLPRTPLSNVGQYSIDLVVQDEYTYSIQILDLSNQAILADLPFDPMDNTLGAVIDKDAIAKLGIDAAPVLEALSKILQEQIGAKELVVMPTGFILPGYILPQNAEFKRLRQASHTDIEIGAASILERHQDLVMELDKKYEMVFGIAELMKKIPHNKPYEEISDFLEGHADFTPGKMTEYKEEDIQGKKARFSNRNVTTIAMLNQQQVLCALLRGLSMGNGFMYLSDETINQDILPLEKFHGDTAEEKEKNRGIFLLAYFLNKACLLVKDQDQFLIIAASGREDIYDAIGFQTFPIKSDDYVATMKFSKPGLALAAIKEKLIRPSFSEVAAISKLGALPAPVTTTNAVVDERQDKVELKNFG